MREREFTQLVDSKKRGGKRRRQILKCVMENPGSSKMDLARMVYGEEGALDGYKSLRSHLNKLKEKKIVEIKNGRNRRVYLTEEGKRLCKAVDVSVHSPQAKEFIRILNGWVLAEPPTPEEIAQIKQLFDDKILEVLFVLGSDPPEPIPSDYRKKYYKLKPALCVWECLRGLWTYEVDLSKWESNKFASKLPSSFGPPSPPFPRASVKLVESEHLSQRIKRISHLFYHLILKNPQLSELRSLVLKEKRKEMK